MPDVDPRLCAAIEHTLLRPDATEEDVHSHVEETLRFGFLGACVHPSWLDLAVEALDGSRAKAITVVGFPLGAVTTATKVHETREAVDAGADEIDVVVHLGHLRAKAWKAFERDLEAVVGAAAGQPVKAILETALWTPGEIVRAAESALMAGVDFLKTSTGFGPGGATVDAVRLLRNTVGDRAGIKASGGIRTAAEALALLDAGADRLGTSASLAIVGAA